MISATNYLFIYLCLTSPEEYHKVKININHKKQKKIYEPVLDKCIPYIPPARMMFEYLYENKDM